MAWYIHKCPECSNLSRHYNKPAYVSSETDVELYSDIFYKRFPFVRCPYCYNIMDVEQTNIFHVRSFQEIYKKKRGDPLHLESHAICTILNLMEYYEILEKMDLSKDKEIEIRKNILAFENDKRRGHSQEIKYIKNEMQNILKLEEFLDYEEDKYLLIEVKRYLGKFDEATTLLNREYDYTYDKELHLNQKKFIQMKSIYLESYYNSDEANAELKKRMY